MDRQRLNAQRRESKQIWNVLGKLEELADEPPPKYGSWDDKKKWREKAIKNSTKGPGYARHTAVTLWIGYRDALAHYHNCHLLEWASRGYINNILQPLDTPDEIEMPFWIYLPSFHENHRGALLQKEIERKEPSWYVEQGRFLAAPPFEGYIWEP